jgi:pilus assembly protein Flp/PilA
MQRRGLLLTGLWARKYLAAALALPADRRAVTAIEYALIAALVSVTIVAGASEIGNTLLTIFNQVAAAL